MMRCEKRKPPAAVMLTSWRPGMTSHSRRLRWRTATQPPPRLMRKVLHILEPSMGIVRPGWTMRFILLLRIIHTMREQCDTRELASSK